MVITRPMSILILEGGSHGSTYKRGLHIFKPVFAARYGNVRDC